MLALRPASTFAALALLLLGAAPLARAQAPAVPRTVTTGFDPRIDGFRVENLGDSVQADGNCWGMSLLSIDAFRRRQAGGGAAADPGPNFRQFPSQADPVDQATYSMVQGVMNDTTGDFPSGPGFGDPSNINAALARMQATGQPEVLLLDGTGGGHAVVLYGYRDGALQVYDPNFPGETTRWPFDPATGLGPHPVGGSFYGALTNVGSVPFDDHPVGAFLNDLRAACSTDGPCLDRYAPITSTTRLGPNGLTVRGQVGQDPGGQRPDHVYLTVNGVPVGAADPNRFGTFTFPTVPRSALRGDGTDVVRVVSQLGEQFRRLRERDPPARAPGPGRGHGRRARARACPRAERAGADARPRRRDQRWSLRPAARGPGGSAGRRSGDPEVVDPAGLGARRGAGGPVNTRLAYAALALLLLAPPVAAQDLPATITTGFDPRVDGFRFENTGDAAEREGNCWGMSLLSIDAYRRRRAAGGAATDPGPNFEQFPSQADPVTQATASFLQTDLNRISGTIASGPAPSDPSNLRASLERIQATGEPEVMLLDGPNGGHAIVLYGYRDGALQVYDPNFPGRAIAWPWSPTTGLGPHPLPPPPGKTGPNFYDSLTGVGAVPFSAHPMAGAIEAMRAACSTDGKCLDRYAPLSSTASVGPDGLTVRGQVTRPAGEQGPAGGVRNQARNESDPDLVYLVVNGVPVAAATPNRFGTFTLPTIPPRALRGDGTDVVRLVSVAGGVFSGFRDVTLPASASRPAATRPAPAATVGMAGRLGG
jgi:hypothetical protein